MGFGRVRKGTSSLALALAMEDKKVLLNKGFV